MSLAPPRDATPLISPADLREAIEGGQLEVYFQPIWDLRAARITGAEALARWQHPRLGPISPAQFVAMAETSGMIAELTRWSVNASLQHAVEARRAGLRLPVSINLSAVAFAERGLVEHLLDALKLWGVPARDLVIEVTETAIISDLDRGAHILDRLSDEGVRVSIDDFGVGNSSFAYLREFPATELKIDRSFVTGMIQNPRSAQLAKAMIDFAHHLGMQVVAEGVEDKATLGKLAELDCDYAQGYVLGHATAGRAVRRHDARHALSRTQAPAGASSDSVAACGWDGRRRGTHWASSRRSIRANTSARANGFFMKSSAPMRWT